MLIDLIGSRFSKLLVVGRHGVDKSGSALWRCVCDCGQSRVIAGTSLRAGRNKSCGCASPRFTAEKTTKHGKSRTRTYKIWQGMRHRCSSAAKGKEKKNYFDKGIRVCDRWNSFELFLLDMGEAPIGASIDRFPNNKGNYEPKNCRWADKEMQANNTTVNRRLSDGKTVAESAKQIGIKPNTLEYRLIRGWSEQRAISQKVQKRSEAG